MEPDWCSSQLRHRRFTGLCGYGLVSTDSCSFQPQPWPTWQVAPDMPLNTPTAGATVRNRRIPRGRKMSMSNQRESALWVMFCRPSLQPLNKRSPSQDAVPAGETTAAEGWRRCEGSSPGRRAWDKLYHLSTAASWREQVQVLIRPTSRSNKPSCPVRNDSFGCLWLTEVRSHLLNRGTHLNVTSLTCLSAPVCD